MIYRAIVDHYKRHGSMARAASDLGVSHGVVKKVLITEGLYSTPLSKTVQEMAASGMSAAAIAEKLDCSLSTVNVNMPYQKGTYLTVSSQKTVNARRIQACRDRKNASKKD